MTTLEFKCLCSHKEEEHNHNPDSAFFGCCESFYLDRVIYNHCACNKYRPDNLRYLEEKASGNNKHNAK